MIGCKQYLKHDLDIEFETPLLSQTKFHLYVLETEPYIKLVREAVPPRNLTETQICRALTPESLKKEMQHKTSFENTYINLLCLSSLPTQLGFSNWLLIQKKNLIKM